MSLHSILKNLIHALFILFFAITINVAQADNSKTKEIEQHKTRIAEFKNATRMLSFEEGRKVLESYRQLTELEPDNFNLQKEYIYILYTFPENVGGNRNQAEVLLNKMAETLPFESRVLRFYLLIKTKRYDSARKELTQLEQYKDRLDEISPLYKLLE